LRPHLGRWFTPDELAPNGPRAAILTHGLWIGRFGSDRNIIGRTIILDGSAAEIVGVMPAGFDFPSPEVRIYMPFQLDRSSAGGWGWHGVNTIARLAPGYTLPQAEAELASLNVAWRKEYGHPQIGHTLYLTNLHEATVGSVAETLWMLMAAVVLVLLIASANVANLLMARGESRTREVSLRVALGAGRGRIVRQLLTESLVLATAGAALGVGLAVVGVRTALLINPDVLPRAHGIAIDLRVLMFTTAMTVGSAVIFGLVPAVQAGARSRGASLGAESRSSESRSRKRVRSVLVAGEVALSVIVVLSAALVGRSFAALTSVDSGFQQTGRLSFGISLPDADYGSVGEVRLAVEELAERLRAVPGVTSVSYTSSLPITGPLSLPDFNIEGRPRPPRGERMHSAQTFVVLPGYVETMGIQLERGRVFNASDDENSLIVALIDREAARVYWPGEDPINQRLGFGFPIDSVRWATIVGVVNNTRAEGPDREIRPQIYLPFAQQQGFWMATSRTGSFVLRTEEDPTILVEGARRAVAAIDANLPLSDIRTLDDIVGQSVAQPRLTSALLGSFAIIALVLSMVGVYGVVSYSVARRTREIGIRLALGANMTRVVRMMIREGAAPAVIGLGVGIVGALAVTSLMADMLYQVSPTDPTTFILFPTILIVVSLFASWLPSRRATLVAPTEALRQE
jgi:predicted permease